MAKLYVVATPIGNLEDITLRGFRILQKVDLIACEDTRRTIKLLNKYEIKKKLISYHQHSHLQKVGFIIEQIKKGKDVALVSDAGTPAIADPGQVLIQKAIENKIDIIPVPGPQAAVTALSASGFPANRFLHVGFLPKKKGRQKLLGQLAEQKIAKTLVFFESPHRISRTLEDLKKALGDVKVAVFRELTKKFEEIWRGKISEVLPKVKPKGEFVIVINKEIEK